MMVSNPSESPNLEQLMQFGIQAARRGNRINAQVIFQQVLDADKQHERAWLWMAAVADTPEDRMRYLNTVLRLNPSSRPALRELDRMKKKSQFSNSLAFRYGLAALALVVIIIMVAIIVLAVA